MRVELSSAVRSRNISADPVAQADKVLASLVSAFTRHADYLDKMMLALDVVEAGLSTISLPNADAPGLLSLRAGILKKPNQKRRRPQTVDDESVYICLALIKLEQLGAVDIEDDSSIARRLIDDSEIAKHLRKTYKKAYQVRRLSHSRMRRKVKSAMQYLTEFYSLLKKEAPPNLRAALQYFHERMRDSGRLLRVFYSLAEPVVEL